MHTGKVNAIVPLRFGVVNRQRFGTATTRVFEVGRTPPTLAQIVASIPAHELPRGFDELGEVRINGDVIPRALWHLVRPRPSRTGHETVVEVLVPLGQGGGAGGAGGGGKNPLATIASIAVLLVAAVVSGGALVPGFAIFSAAQVSAVVGAGIARSGLLDRDALKRKAT